MARNRRDDDTPPNFSFGEGTVYGNVVRDTVPITDDGGIAAVDVACNSRLLGEEATMFVKVTAFNNYAAYALGVLEKGDRVAVKGDLYADEYEGEVSLRIQARFIGLDRGKWYDLDEAPEDEAELAEDRLDGRGSGNKKRRSSGNSRRRKDEDEGEERPARSRRSRSSKDDDEEDGDEEEKPARRTSSRRSSSRRSARTVKDSGDDVDE